LTEQIQIGKFVSAAYDRHRLTSLALVFSNVIPLIGVLFFGWLIFDVVLLYWIENVIIGVFNLIKIICCFPSLEADTNQVGSSSRQNLSEESHPGVQAAHAAIESGLAGQLVKVFLVPFFTVHYGMFCFVHGVFIVNILDPDTEGFANPFAAAAEKLQVAWFAIAVLGMLASHGVSLVSNFFLKGKFRRTQPFILMFSPYGRIVLLHIVILFGAFLTMSLGSPIWLLVLFVVLKTIFDLVIHLAAHSITAAPEDS